LLIEEVRLVAAQACTHENLAALGESLEEGAALAETALDWILGQGRDSIGEVLAGGVPFLRLLGLVCGGWQMTRAGLAAHALLQKGEGDETYLRGIIHLAQFYFAHLAPQAAAHARVMLCGGMAVEECSDAYF
jgi:acyl-CoA dehydrogenase